MALSILLVGRWVVRRVATALRRALVRGGADPMLGSFLRDVVLLVLVAVGARAWSAMRTCICGERCSDRIAHALHGEAMRPPRSSPA